MEGNDENLKSTSEEVVGNKDDLISLIELHHKTYDVMDEKHLDESQDERIDLHMKILKLKLKLEKEGVDISDVPTLYNEGEHEGIIIPPPDKPETEQK